MKPGGASQRRRPDVARCIQASQHGEALPADEDPNRRRDRAIDDPAHLRGLVENANPGLNGAFALVEWGSHTFVYFQCGCADRSAIEDRPSVIAHRTPTHDGRACFRDGPCACRWYQVVVRSAPRQIGQRRQRARRRQTVQHDFEQRGNRGRGESDRGGYTQRNDFDQRNEDRDYERTFGNYGESSGEFDPRQRRPQGSSGADRARMTDRERYADQQRHDRYSDEMRGFDISPDDWSGEQSGRWTSNRGYDDNRSSRGGGYQQRSSGRSGSPYDRGEIGSWYGGDSGMGDTGSSLSGRQHDRGQYGQGQFDRGQRDRGQSGWDTPSQRQASSQYSQPSYKQHQFDQQHFSDRFGADRFAEPQGWRRGPSSSDRDDSIEGPFTVAARVATTAPTSASTRTSVTF